MKTLLWLTLPSLFLSAAQAQTLPAKYIDVKYTLLGCQRNDNDVRCVLSAIATGNSDSDLLHIGDADTSALANGQNFEPGNYDVGGAGRAITGSIGKIYKSAPTQVSFVFSNLPKQITIFNVLNVQGAIFKNVKISSFSATNINVNRDFLEKYQVILNNCTISNKALSCNGVTLTPRK